MSLLRGKFSVFVATTAQQANTVSVNTKKEFQTETAATLKDMHLIFSNFDCESLILAWPQMSSETYFCTEQ